MCLSCTIITFRWKKNVSSRSKHIKVLGNACPAFQFPTGHEAESMAMRRKFVPGQAGPTVWVRLLHKPARPRVVILLNHYSNKYSFRPFGSVTAKRLYSRLFVKFGFLNQGKQLVCRLHRFFTDDLLIVSGDVGSDEGAG